MPGPTLACFAVRVTPHTIVKISEIAIRTFFHTFVSLVDHIKQSFLADTLLIFYVHRLRAFELLLDSSSMFVLYLITHPLNTIILVVYAGLAYRRVAGKTSFNFVRSSH